MENNPVIDRLPAHLRRFIKDQDYAAYTAIDHAVWRYVMRVNVDYLSKVAHESYLEGLRKAGLEIEHIAHMYGMNRILQEIGWASVAVDGFIPPSAFMEFQAYNVLVIAADIRQLKHIEYTPAPDIIHEAAGHAPIIADPEYAEYLRYFGEIGCKAISSAKDYELYEAIRHLSIIKEYPFTPQESIEEAERAIEHIQANMGEPSEMALIRRLHWWTVEYGLIGTLEQPRIYGAGLLSSIGESVSCLRPEVRKLPYTLDAMNVEFDITKPQPQLFITPDFQHLTTVLNEFADTMALRRGGSYGIRKAVESKNIATAVLSSGLQISGIFDMLVEGPGGQPALFATHSASALAYEDKQWADHDKSVYREGFTAICGLLKGLSTPPELLGDRELGILLLNTGATVSLEWGSGVHLNGTVDSFLRAENGNLLLIKFTNCRVTYRDTTYYEGAVFNLTVGARVTSVYSGAADRTAFKDLPGVPAEHTYKVLHDSHTRRLQELYADVRAIRHGGSGYEKLPGLFATLREQYSDDWLLSLEIYELLVHQPGYRGVAEEIRAWLEERSVRYPEYTKLIFNGLKLIDNTNPVEAV